MASTVRRNCTDNGEFLRTKSEYSNYLLRAGYDIGSIDNPFENVQLLSQETLVCKTKENHVKVPILRLSRNVSLLLHPHIILLSVKYTKLFAKSVD